MRRMCFWIGRRKLGLLKVRSITSQFQIRLLTFLPQGVNDYYVYLKCIPEDAYSLLKAQSCAYRQSKFSFSESVNSNMIIVPYLLSMWAVFHGRYPASRFRPNLSSEEADAYDGKATNLLVKDLGDAVKAVWTSIPELDRDFMVSMYLSRPAERKEIVHLKPTINEAMQVLASDERLFQVEKDTAADYIPHLVDKYEVPLFNPWYVSGT